MRKKIIISKPYIKNCKSDVLANAVRLCAEVTMYNPNTKKEEKKECYFEFEAQYKPYLCFERSDAFVVGLLSSAQELNMDIEFTAPISEQLYYQLSKYYIPLVSKYNSDYPMHNISLIGPYENNTIKNEGAVVTGCSGGVDSFYTIASHNSDRVPEQFQLTHLIYSSSGTSDIIEKRMKETYKNTLLEIKKIAKTCNLETIACYNNLNEFYLFPFSAFTTFFTTTFCSVGFALQKLVNTYYASSAEVLSDFHIELGKLSMGYDAASFDIFTLSCLNTENLRFYSTGTECTRTEKEKYISDYKPAQKFLNVCTVQSYYEATNKKYINCGICAKCLRTMVQLYSFNKLDLFKEVFDVEYFYQHKAKLIGKMMGLNRSAYVKEMKESAKKCHVKIPICSYFYAYLLYRPIKILRKTFKKSLLARKIYYKFKLDYKLDGYRGPTYEAYKDKIK